MIGFIYYSASNPVHRTIEVSHELLLPEVDQEGDEWLVAPDLPAVQWMAVLGPAGPEVVPFEREPALALEIAVREKRELVNKIRFACETRGCNTPLGRVDTDADSQRKINGAVSMAMISQTVGQPFEEEWTMADNSVVTHDAPSMIAMGVAVGQHVSACHKRATTLKGEVEAAQDMEALEQINIQDGWPD